MPSLNVRQRAEAVGTFRYVNVFLMETLARWVPSTPEMEAKVLFGRHIWRTAQKADAFGLRARELRAPLHYSVPPSEACVSALRMGSALQPTAERIAAYYDALLGALSEGYETYLERTDRLIDEPTVVIIESGLREIEAMKAESVRLLEEFPALRLGAPGRLAELRSALASGGGIVPSEPAGNRHAAAAN
jgi:hypothetical protein